MQRATLAKKLVLLFCYSAHVDSKIIAQLQTPCNQYALKTMNVLQVLSSVGALSSAFC